MRAGQHLHQVADLAVRAQQLRAQHQANRPLGKLRLEFLDRFHRGVGHVAYAKKNLVWSLVFLQAVAGKGGIHLRIKPFNRLENADPRLKIGQRPS